MRRLFSARFPEARWIEYEPALSDSELLGSELAFGAPYRVLLRPEQARVVVSLDADLLGPTTPGGVAYARAFAAQRSPEHGKMSRIYCVESTPTALGTLADHRLALRSGFIKAVVAYLDYAISEKARPLPELGPAQPKPDAAFLAEPSIEKFLRVLVSDLLEPHHLGKSLVAVGDHQHPEVHALVNRINALLGNAGNTVVYLEQPKSEGPPQLTAFRQLVEEMNADAVDTLLILGGKPVFTSPSDVDFRGALAKVKHSIHLSLYDD
jgi:molybdopterin-containing oxidoreductase family iron-sulfur binding subunit